jgi:HK97 gp10 family phage protein
MLQMTEFTINGLEALLGKLENLKQDVRFKSGRAALRKAANVIAAAAKQNASRLDDAGTAESIEKNIAIRWDNKRAKATGDLAFRIGVLGGARQYAKTRQNVRKGKDGDTYVTGGDKTNPGGDTWYWRLLEFGTEHSASRPLMRDAAARASGDAVNTFATEYSKAVDRAIRRAAKKAAQ